MPNMCTISRNNRPHYKRMALLEDMICSQACPLKIIKHEVHGTRIQNCRYLPQTGL